ncbi:MAG: ABC-type transport auxiliary lipoprotein family protein [Terriglobia bacterium]
MGRLILVSLAAMLVGSCGGGRPIHYYTVELPPAPEPSKTRYPVALLVGRIDAPEILQDEPIVYRSGPNEIGTYAYHQWDVPPAKMVRDLLIRRLRASGKYRSVDELGSIAEGDYVLDGKLYDFEEVDRGSIEALVSMEFELFDRRNRKSVWTYSYSQSIPVQGKEISDVVSTLNHNLDRGLNEMASGLDSYFSENVHGKP